MILKFGIFSIFFLQLISSGNCVCNCQIDAGTLSCTPGTIFQFPEDVLQECTFDIATIKDIQISHQPFTLLKNDAFSSFVGSGITAIALEFNKIERIERDAFRGMENNLQILFLKSNAITEVEPGALDNLVKLEILDLRHNDELFSYTTTSWNLRLRVIKEKLFFQGDLTFIQDLNIQNEALNNLYCETWRTSSVCPLEGGVANCVGQSLLDIEDSICSLKQEAASSNLNSVMMDFPVDISYGEVENFYEGESASFIRNFNAYGTHEDLNYAKLRPTQVLYGTKFDLSTLMALTSNITQEVTVKADTITISQPIQIHYKLKLVGRVVAITQPITMTINNQNIFSPGALVEPWTYSEKLVVVNHELALRERKFGLIEILDEEFGLPSERTITSFEPVKQVATTEKVSPWLDRTFLNLKYVCGRTLLTSKSNIPLSSHISTFALRLLNDSALVNNQAIFNTAQKFKRLQQQSQQNIIVHNVPAYTMDTIKQLAQSLHTSMSEYRDNEIVMEERLFGSTARMQDMNQQFIIVENQQEMYFQTEMTQLEAIWADSSNQWAFDNEHRETIKQATDQALEAMMNATFQMQEQEYKELLSKAESSVAHLDAVITSYQAQVNRLSQKAESSIQVQNFYSNELNRCNENVQRETQEFDRAVEAWKAEQVVGGFLGFLKAIVSVFTSDFEGVIDGIQAAEEAAMEIANLMKALYKIMDTIMDLLKKFENMTGSDLVTVTGNIDTEFSAALKNSVDLKLQGPQFDEFESKAMIDIDGVNEATDNEIEGANELMSALMSVSNVGKRLINEVSDFADIMLQLAATQNELSVAIEDKVRAVEEVTRINSMIEELKEAQRIFEQDRLAAMAEYEAKLAQMKEEYIIMTDSLRAEYREEITARYEQYKTTFNQGRQSYLAAIGNLMYSIHLKNLALKDNSMIHRAMIMALYADFCDTQYYHSFTDCSATQTPIMGDDFQTLLTKLAEIEWETITSIGKLPIPPTNFGDENPEAVFVVDSRDIKISVPVETLKNESKVDINLYHHNEANFNRFWRIRLDMIRVVLLDKLGNPVPSPISEVDRTIKILITFPTLFNDTDINRERISFLSQDYLCPADYYVEAGVVKHVSQCEVDAEFTNTNYKPAPDGYFTITLINPTEFPVKDLDKLRVEFSGSYIPYSPTETNWFSA